MVLTNNSRLSKDKNVYTLSLCAVHLNLSVLIEKFCLDQLNMKNELKFFLTLEHWCRVFLFYFLNASEKKLSPLSSYKFITFVVCV